MDKDIDQKGVVIMRGVRVCNSNPNEDEFFDKDNVFDINKDVACVIDLDSSKYADNNGNHLLKILNLTDIHYSHDRKNLSDSIKLITSLINSTNPDLITLTGDQISFYGDKDEYLQKLCYFIDGFGIPWAPILGNHEGFTNVEREDIGTEYCSGKYKNIIFRKNDKLLGVGNYIINITYKNRIVHSIFMLDSHTDKIYPNGKKDYDYIWDNQLIWYKWASEGIDLYNNESVKKSCFLHIPLVEYIEAWKGYKKGKYLGKNANNEPICCPQHKSKHPYNNGFFDVIKNANTRLVLCGHDHTNASEIEYQGVTLAYGLCTRGNRYCNGKMTAGTTITIDNQGNFALDDYYFIRNKIKHIPNVDFIYKIISKLHKFLFK